MVITKSTESDYRYMLYTGKIRATSDNMWLVVAEQFAMTDLFDQFGKLDTIKRDDDGKLSLYYHDDEYNTNLIEVTYESMGRLVAGEIVEVHIW